jgi:RHS repeat-associated protein
MTRILSQSGWNRHWGKLAIALFSMLAMSAYGLTVSEICSRGAQCQAVAQSYVNVHFPNRTFTSASAACAADLGSDGSPCRAATLQEGGGSCYCKAENIEYEYQGWIYGVRPNCPAAFPDYADDGWRQEPVEWLNPTCYRPTFEIKLFGHNATKVSALGPALAQTATVSRNGVPIANQAVSVSITGGAQAISGITDSSGNYAFTYVPPRSPIVAQVIATCTNCTNTAIKAITVAGSYESCPSDLGTLEGNPVSPALGLKVQTEIDYADSFPHGLNLLRYYVSSPNVKSESMGEGWSHNYEGSIEVTTDKFASISFGSGYSSYFVRDQPNGPWYSNPTSTSNLDRLEQQGNIFVYYRDSDNSTWTFSNTNPGVLPIVNARLSSIAQRNGWATNLSYNTVGKLVQATNAFGRTIAFTYNGGGQLANVTVSDGSAISYGYAPNGILKNVNYPAMSGALVGRTYHYEIAAFPNLLTGITDEAGQRYATFSFDNTGRAVGTQRTGGIDNYTIRYPADASGAVSGQGTLLSGDQSIDLSIFRTSAQVTDPLGNVRTVEYQGGDGTVRVLTQSSPAGGGSFVYRGFAQGGTLPTQETDFLGVQTMYTWDISRRLPLSTTQAAGRPEAQTSSTQWHPTFRLPTLVTEQGRTTAYTYDAQGNKLTQAITDTTSGQVRTWAWTYNTAGLVATSTDPKGGIATYAYNAQGNATSMTNPLGHVSTYTYDAAGRLATQTEPNGLASSYTYDARGRLLTSATGSGAALEATAYTYHPTGQLATAVLPSGYSAAYTYDAAQRLVAAVDNRGNRIDYTLDAMGNRLREEVKDPGGNIALLTRRAVNQLNRVSSLQTAQNQTTNIGFDLNGDAISETDPLNQTTAQTLDGLRRPVATTFADNSAASQNYNQLDQLTSVTDPKGVATSYTRNAFGEVTQEASADMGSISYQRNAAGEVTGSTDANGNTTQITRDALGRPLTVTRTSPTGTTAHVTTYIYDTGSTGSQIGYLASMQDLSGVTTYQRDSFGRVLAKTQQINDNPAAPGTYTTRYTYSTGPNKGELASITYPSGLRAIYNRSASGQITSISTQVPGLNKPVVPFVSGISYTALNQPKAWNWASGDAAARTFDADGRMTSNELASYTFDAASRITGITQQLWASRTVTQVIGTATTVVTQLYQTPLTWAAAYDNRNRLTGFNRAGSASGFSYDANSNRLTAVDQTISDTNASGGFELADTALTTNQTLSLQSGSNRLLGFAQTLTRVQGTRTLATTNSTINYALDANGNLTSDGLRSFEYDASNRLAKVRILKDGEAASIKYFTNGQGQQVFKSEPKPDQYLPDQSQLGTGFIAWLKTNFGWLYAQAQTDASLGSAYMYADGQLPSWAVLGEYDNGSASGTGRTEYIWLPTEDGGAIPIGMFRNSKFLAIHSDHLGTPRLMTDSLNKPAWQWPYSAFGNNKPTGILKHATSATGAFTNQPVLLATQNPAAVLDLRFPGQMADEETGLFYNYFRSYQPSQGRFTQPDPIGLGGGLNRFGYVEGNPISKIDPTGEVAFLVPIIVSGVVTGYGTYSLLNAQKKCEVACEMTHGDDVKACGDPERDDILGARKNQRILACKASCTFGSAMGRLLPGKLK